MVIILRKITDPETPEEKIEDTPIIDVHFNDKTSVTEIRYRLAEFPLEESTWSKIDDGWESTWAKTDNGFWKADHRPIRNILVIDGKEYDKAQVKAHHAELKLLFDRMHTEKLLEEIDNDQGSFEEL